MAKSPVGEKRLVAGNTSSVCALTDEAIWNIVNTSPKQGDHVQLRLPEKIAGVDACGRNKSNNLSPVDAFEFIKSRATAVAPLYL